MPENRNYSKNQNNLISGLIRFSYGHKRMMAALIIVFTAVSPFIIKGIRFETTSSSNSLPNDPISRVYTDNLKRFGDSETLIIYLEFSGNRLKRCESINR